jgi:hypothetical protein
MDTVTAARATEEGVAFTIEAGFGERDCMVSRHALDFLMRLLDGTPDPLDVYKAFEPTIHRAARRLVLAGESASPLVLETAYFIDVGKPMS